MLLICHVKSLRWLLFDTFQVEKARELKDELIQQRQQHLDEKQRRAEQQRLSVLQEKVRKAQEEEAKVSLNSKIMFKTLHNILHTSS